jgi:excisionase family DNA binding protein
MATDYLTTAELAQRLRLSPETIRQMAGTGKIPSLRISPKVIRFDLQAVTQAIQKRSTQRRVSRG